VELITDLRFILGDSREIVITTPSDFLIEDEENLNKEKIQDYTIPIL